MIEITRKLQRKTDVWIGNRRLHVRLFPGTISLWLAHSHRKIHVPLELVWEYACRLDRKTRKASAAEIRDAKRQFQFEFEAPQ